MAPTWASNNACASTGNTLRTSVRSRSSRGEKRFQNKLNLRNTDHVPLLDEHTTVEPQLTATLYRFESGAFHQLNAVAERISDVHVGVTRQRFCFHHFNASSSKFEYKLIQISNEQTRMSFTGWPKIRIDTQMNLHSVTLEPHASALCEIWRFRNLWDS